MSERLRYTELAPEGIAALRGLEHYLNATTALPAVLLELVRLRVSLLNGCEFCVGHHVRELQKHHEPQSRLDALKDWASSDAFTGRERQALAWADTITKIQEGHADGAAYEAVSEYFEGKDLVDLTLAVASTNAWNRMSIAFKAEWDPSRGKAQAAAAKGSATGVPGTHGDSSEAALALPGSGTAASSTTESTPAHQDAPTKDAVDDDGGKVAHD